MSKNERTLWVDGVKFICIISVMNSHLESAPICMRKFYLPFFLTAFYFVSGYTYKPKNNFGFFLYKKVRQLFVPWLIFGLFRIFSAQILTFHMHDNFLLELKWNFLQIRGHGDAMWFVAALFVAYIPFYFL